MSLKDRWDLSSLSRGQLDYIREAQEAHRSLLLRSAEKRAQYDRANALVPMKQVHEVADRFGRSRALYLRANKEAARFGKLLDFRIFNEALIAGEPPHLAAARARRDPSKCYEVASGIYISTDSPKTLAEFGIDPGPMITRQNKSPRPLSGGPRSECPICGQMFPNHDALSAHYERTHEKSLGR